MPRFTLLFAVCFTYLFVLHLQATDAPAFIELKGDSPVTGYVLFSPDGKKVATGGVGTTVIWDAESGHELHKLNPNTDAIEEAPNNDDRRIAYAATFTYFSPRLAFSPDGKKIVTLSLDKTARVWDVESGKELQKLEGHTKYLIFAAFSPNGKKVATGSTDETVRIWDAESGKELHKLKGLIILEDQSRIARSNNRGYSGNYVSAAAFTQYGQEIVLMCNPHTYTKSQIAAVYDVESGEKLEEEMDTASFRLLFAPAPFSPDGEKVAIEQMHGAGGSYATVMDADARLGSFDTVDSKGQTPARVTHGTGLGNETRFNAFSPDGTKFVTFGCSMKIVQNRAFQNWEARIWDSESGRELHRLDMQGLEGFPGWSGHAAFSPDGKRVITVSGGTARIWTLE